jgi:DNA polymerase III subunit alpha
MPQADFVHLHSHSMYSLLDGACKTSAMAATAAEWGMPAVSITDHGNLFGAIEFYKEVKKVGLNPIIGCEVYCAIESRFSRKPARGRDNGANHLVLLAKDLTGYKNLIQLVTAGYLEGFYYNPRIDKELLRKHAEGLVCLSACVSGEIPHLIDREGIPAARSAVEEYLDIFGDNFYLEIQRHGIDKEAKINEGLVRLHKDMGVPLVATNDSHFLRAEDHEAHAALIAIQTGKMLDDPKRMCYPEGVFYKSPEEMRELFHDLPQSLEATLEIESKCDLELTFGEYHAPEFPLPSEYETADAFLEHLARQGLDKRCQNITPEYEARLQFELDIISQTGYPGYFLILGDLVDFSKEAGVRASARGSAVSSLVAYSLGITSVDPMEHGLYFERFLNPERISMPDIDLDIADRDREKLIDYVVEKYGRENVCQIITFGTMGAKGVIRDVGRVLDMPFADVDRISKLVPAELKMTLDKALEASPDLRAISEDGGVGQRLLKIAQQLEGLARHASVHAAAVVITPEPVTEYVPLYKSPKGQEVVTQFPFETVEELGLLKMDFLGLRNLTVLGDAVHMIHRNHGLTVDIDTLEMDDQATLELFGRGETVGVFQFESPPMRDYLQKLKPDRFGDIIALNALYRPGPMKYIPNYIARKHGSEKVVYHHALAEPTLKETYGIITYQEQVMELCRNLAGFTLGHADGIRKAMGKKLADVMEKYRNQFMEGTQEQGIDKESAKKIWSDIEVFSGYGFNKAHSSGYALVAYQCAYLKAHYPAEYMAANLNSEIGDIDRLVILIDECRRIGIEVLPPDVNQSFVDFVASGESILMGMAAVRNVGRTAVEALVKAREEGGAFPSLFDFCERVDLRAVNRRAVESLICAGAFDSVGAHRAQHLAGLDQALDQAQAAQAARSRGQISLFDADGMEEQAAVVNNHTLPTVPEWSERERLTREKEMLGFYLSGHPLARYSADLGAMGIRATGELENLPDGAEIKLGGLLAEIKSHTDRNGRPMIFAVLEDLDGTMDLVVFPDTYERCKDVLVPDAVIVVQGRMSGRNGRTSVQVEQALPVEKAREALADGVNVSLPQAVATPKRMEDLKHLMEQHPGDCALYLHLQQAERKFTVIRSRRLAVSPTEALFSQIQDLIGEDCRVWVSAESVRARRAARRPRAEPQAAPDRDAPISEPEAVPA